MRARSRRARARESPARSTPPFIGEDGLLGLLHRRPGCLTRRCCVTHCQIAVACSGNCCHLSCHHCSASRPGPRLPQTLPLQLPICSLGFGAFADHLTARRARLSFRMFLGRCISLGFKPFLPLEPFRSAKLRQLLVRSRGPEIDLRAMRGSGRACRRKLGVGNGRGGRHAANGSAEPMAQLWPQMRRTACAKGTGAGVLGLAISCAREEVFGRSRQRRTFRPAQRR